MVHKTLLLSAGLMMSFGTLALDNTKTTCGDKNSDVCQAYISGVVEGYIASKQKYVHSKASFDDQYATKAYATRVGNAHARLATNMPKPACLPNEIDKEELIAHLALLNKENDLTVELGDYLREQYPCTN